MIPKNTVREVVLYYNPSQDKKANQVKGVLIRMGIRIKNVAPEQVNQTIGELLGITGNEIEPQEKAPFVSEEMLVMYKFTGSRIDQLLLNLRRAKIPKIDLKAVVTENNVNWTFYRLYEELKEEHEKMQEPQ